MKLQFNRQQLQFLHRQIFHSIFNFRCCTEVSRHLRSILVLPFCPFLKMLHICNSILVKRTCRHIRAYRVVRIVDLSQRVPIRKSCKGDKNDFSFFEYMAVLKLSRNPMRRRRRRALATDPDPIIDLRQKYVIMGSQTAKKFFSLSLTLSLSLSFAINARMT